MYVIIGYSSHRKLIKIVEMYCGVASISEIKMYKKWHKSREKWKFSVVNLLYHEVI